MGNDGFEGRNGRSLLASGRCGRFNDRFLEVSEIF